MAKVIGIFIKLSIITMLAGLPFLLIILLRAFISESSVNIAVIIDGLSGSDEQIWAILSVLRTEAIGMMNDLPYSSFFMPFMYRHHLVGFDPTQMSEFANITDFLARHADGLVEQRNILLDISKGLAIAVLFSLFGGLFRKEKRSITLTFFVAVINFSILLVIAVCVSAIFSRISLLGEVANYFLLLLSSSGAVTAMIVMLRKKCSKLEIEFKLSSTVGSVLVDGLLKPFIRTAFMIFTIACFINGYFWNMSAIGLQLAAHTPTPTDIWGTMSFHSYAGALPMTFVIGIIITMVLMDLMDNKLRTKLQVSLSAKSSLNVPFSQVPFPQPPPPQAPLPQPNQPAPSPKAFCTQCGAGLAENSKFCTGCGTKIN